MVTSSSGPTETFVSVVGILRSNKDLGPGDARNLSIYICRRASSFSFLVIDLVRTPVRAGRSVEAFSLGSLGDGGFAGNSSIAIVSKLPESSGRFSGGLVIH